MPLPDTTPIRDPRNAVGLMVDAVRIGFVSGDVAEPWNAMFVQAIDLGAEFSKSSRRVFNGYERRDGADLYQRIKTTIEKLNSADFSFFRSQTKIEAIGTLRTLCDRLLDMAELTMRNFDGWKAYTEPGKTPGGYPNYQTTTTPPLWHQTWHDFVSMLLRLGADVHQIHLRECSWRFRDLTARKHRGLSTRAAFEAAWLAGQYKFARRLLET